MANFTIVIPNNKVTDVVEALCAHFKYKENSGLTKNQFAKQQIRNFIRGIYIDYKVNTFNEQRAQIGQLAKDFVSDLDVT